MDNRVIENSIVITNNLSITLSHRNKLKKAQKKKKKYNSQKILFLRMNKKTKNR